MKAFRCAQCGTPISHPLVELDDVGRLSFEDATPHVPRGTYLPLRRHPSADWVGSLSDDDADGLLLNLEDVVNTHLDGVLHGCCGIDGCGGINTFCPRGHEIGIEFSDCWGPHELRVPKRCVEAVEVPDALEPPASSQP